MNDHVINSKATSRGHLFKRKHRTRHLMFSRKALHANIITPKRGESSFEVAAKTPKKGECVSFEPVTPRSKRPFRHIKRTIDSRTKNVQ